MPRLHDPTHANGAPTGAVAEELQRWKPQLHNALLAASQGQPDGPGARVPDRADGRGRLVAA